MSSVPPQPVAKLATWRIEGEMTLARAAELKEGLAAALRSPGPFEVDLSGVTDLDGAGVQLLILARRMAEKHSRPMTVLLSPAATSVAQLVALQPLFGSRPAERA